jgi:hypothetical protein
MLMGALGWSCPSAVRSVLLLTWLPSPGVIPDLLSDPGAGGTLSRVWSPPIGLHRTETSSGSEQTLGPGGERLRGQSSGTRVEGDPGQSR